MEGTGHDCEVARTVARKNDIKLNTVTGGVVGERSLNVELGEQTTVENTKEIYPGKCRDIEDRYGHICRDDVQRNLYRCRPVFLPCADAGADSRIFLDILITID